MKNLLGGTLRENLVVAGAGLCALLLLIFSWARERSLTWPGWETLILALLLVGCLILADHFPVHIRYATKATMTSVPLFLIATLLPTLLALVTAAAGISIAQVIARRERGLLPLDFIMDPARWIIIVFFSSSVAHLPVPAPEFHDLLLVVASMVMFGADVFTFSLFTSLDIQEPLLRLIRDSFQQVFSLESIQYLIGVLGVLAFQQARWALLLLIVPTVIVYVAFKNVKEMHYDTREMLIHMADAVDLRDPYTGGHSRRVAELAAQVTRQMQVQGQEADLIETAARLHDIGKIGIPDAVLNKPGSYDESDWAIMQQHVIKGADLLSGYTDFARGAQMVLSHHERWDGKGYPNGLKGHEIPFGARIIAVADAYDAMTTDRPYRSAKTCQAAMKILSEGRGTQWDPEVVDALLAKLRAQMENTRPIRM